MARNVLNWPKELSTTSWFSNANLKAYYRFNNLLELTDSTTNAHTLTAIGVPVQGTPKFGGSVGLGTSQAFSAVDGADFQPAGNFSISAWVRSKYSADQQYIFQSYSANTNIAGTYLILQTNGTIKLLSGKNTGTTSGTDYKTFTSTTNTMGNGVWRHVVGTYDGAKLHIYIDGAEEGTGVAWTDAAAFAATNYVRVGCGNATGTNTPFFAGSLSEVLFFNGTALSLAQVQSLYANSINHASNAAIKADANLKAIYLFADGAQLTDSTANNHTLTAIGTPTTLTTKFGGSIFLGNSSAYSSVDHADFQPTGNFTVGGWIKSATNTGSIFTSYSKNTNEAGIKLDMSGDSLILLSGKNTGTTLHTDYEQIVGSTSLTNNTWHFVVGTWDGSYLRIYVDGVSDATAIAWANAPAYAATNYVRIGCRNKTGSNENIITAQLDDVFLLNGTAWTDAQVALAFNGRNSITQARTVLTYPRTPIGGVYIPGAKSIEGATGDTATTSEAWIENQKYGWYCKFVADAFSAEFDTAVTRTGAKTLKLSTTDTTGRVRVYTNPTNSTQTLFRLKPSTQYILKLYVKTNNVASNSVKVTLDQYTSVFGTNTSTQSNTLTGTNDWTLLTLTVTTDATTAFGALRPRLDVAGNVSDCWFDVNSLTLTEVLPRNPVV